MTGRTYVFNTRPMKERRRELRKVLTKHESVLWFHLRNRRLGNKFYRQYGVGPYVLDFYCAEKNWVLS